MSEASLRLVPSPPKPLTVAELNRTVKSAVEERFPSLWVEGEIAAVKVMSSGHVYFDLKDEREDARVSCAMWKGNAQRSKAHLAVGERVQLRGKPGLFVPRGQFQFIAEVAVPSGAGEAAARLAALKEKLRAEGLFDDARKRPLPRFPRAIGVVTSGTGAAFHDIVREATRRWPARIVLAPALVQGADAPASIVRALSHLQRAKWIEVIIVGRGGGASEDLAAFNDERVARAIADCRVPIVSAVGHDVDHTVADLVADQRAATPTQAAAYCTPDLNEVVDRIETARQRMRRAVLLKSRTLGNALARARPPDPRLKINEARQRIDDLLRRAEDALTERLRRCGQRLDRAEKALSSSHPKTRLASDRAALAALVARLQPAVTKALERRADRVEDLRARLAPAVTDRVESRAHALGLAAARLDALSPVKILARGYAVALREGRALTSSSQVAPGEVITVRLHEGEVDARVERAR
ncbi:MAG: exodeoxyribonuclease VII large subunit [Polyangiales bacterium]